MDATRHTCLKLDTDPCAVFIKGTWYLSAFHLSITDGLNAWICEGSEDQVRERAALWDQPPDEYVRLAEKHLGVQIPGSVYKFTDAGDGCKRLSWTFLKEDTWLEWRWKCHPSSESQKATLEILDFLMDANIKLSEEVLRKTHSFEQLKIEAEKCLAQSERLTREKAEFEDAMYAKFVIILNSKKQKLRQLRDQLASKQASARHFEEESSGKSEDSDDNNNET